MENKKTEEVEEDEREKTELASVQGLRRRRRRRGLTMVSSEICRKPAGHSNLEISDLFGWFGLRDDDDDDDETMTKSSLKCVVVADTLSLTVQKSINYYDY